MKFHELFPDTNRLSADELASFIARNAKETPFDTEKKYLGEDEKIEYALESSVNGRGINRLNTILESVSKIVKKGTTSDEKALVLVFHTDDNQPVIEAGDDRNVIVIPPTVGTKVLDLQRRQNDDMLEIGYIEEQIQLYGLPSAESECMEFFDSNGVHFAARTRGLSMKEKKQYFGAFTKMRNVKEGTVDTETGELKEAVGQ